MQITILVITCFKRADRRIVRKVNVKENPRSSKQSPRSSKRSPRSGYLVATIAGFTSVGNRYAANRLTFACKAIDRRPLRGQPSTICLQCYR